MNPPLDKKQFFAIAVGLVLLGLLVLPSLLSTNSAPPMTLNFAAYTRKDPDRILLAEFEAKNRGHRVLLFETMQPEFLAPDGRWKPDHINKPGVRNILQAGETSHLRIQVPEVGQDRPWRIPVYCIAQPSRPEAWLARVLIFLKLRNTAKPVPLEFLYSSEIPPAGGPQFDLR